MGQHLWTEAGGPPMSVAGVWGLFPGGDFVFQGAGFAEDFGEDDGLLHVPQIGEQRLSVRRAGSDAAGPLLGRLLALGLLPLGGGALLFATLPLGIYPAAAFFGGRFPRWLRLPGGAATLYWRRRGTGMGALLLLDQLALVLFPLLLRHIAGVLWGTLA